MTFYLLKNTLWFGEDTENHLLTVATRSLVMFLVILIGLRILGKRGVKQLSVFELVVIIGLGSAAGDPMMYKTVGLVPAIVVFISIILLYKMVTWMVAHSVKIEKWVEGVPVCLIKDGTFCIKDSNKETVAQDEFFAELRLQGVSQLGQVHRAYVETNGEISVFFRKDQDVTYGLPLLPEDFTPAKRVDNSGYYACGFCGYTSHFESSGEFECPQCSKKRWVRASKVHRVT